MTENGFYQNAIDERVSAQALNRSLAQEVPSQREIVRGVQSWQVQYRSAAECGRRVHDAGSRHYSGNLYRQ